MVDQKTKTERYRETSLRTQALLEGETDWIAAMATVACEYHHQFSYYHWTGFYRAVSPELLVIGPYQGSHGCTRISFEHGVCGAAARTLTTQRVADVHQFPGHIACSATTQSEIVVPIVSPNKKLLGVLDIDSDALDAFDAVDQAHLEALCATLGAQFSFLLE